MMSLTVLLAIFLSVGGGGSDAVRQATGVKVGDVSPTEAIVWVRLTQNDSRNAGGAVLPARPPKPPAPGVVVESLRGSCPGASGKVRLVYGIAEDLKDATATDWVTVGADTDFAHQFRLTGLRPATVYHYASETAGPGDAPVHGQLRGRFRTAPTRGEFAPVTFTVITGQAYRDLDHPEGYNIYPAMGKLEPDFHVATGDTVYYDTENPMATSEAAARYHWQRMFSLPRLVAFYLRVPAYFIKDDHDTCHDDCWPGQVVPHMQPMTFEEGVRIFREQVPVGERPYRTFRWGRGLQVWLPEGREFRSPNPMADGSGKTIWGEEQKAWLKQSLLASDADWRILISATPMVGPDRKTKADNHANAAFAHEGNEFRRWARDNLPDNFFVICGDRHWQYHSVHPETGIHEFSCGPASDEHAGGTPGEDPEYHRFHRVRGGFLSVTVRPLEVKSGVAFRFHDVHGNVVYEYLKGTE